MPDVLRYDNVIMDEVRQLKCNYGRGIPKSVLCTWSGEAQEPDSCSLRFLVNRVNELSEPTQRRRVAYGMPALWCWWSWDSGEIWDPK